MRLPFKGFAGSRWGIHFCMNKLSVPVCLFKTGDISCILNAIKSASILIRLMNQILLDKSILHSVMVKHNCEINEITYCLAIQLIYAYSIKMQFSA